MTAPRNGVPVRSTTIGVEPATAPSAASARPGSGSSDSSTTRFAGPLLVATVTATCARPTLGEQLGPPVRTVGPTA